MSAVLFKVRRWVEGIGNVSGGCGVGEVLFFIGRGRRFLYKGDF